MRRHYVINIGRWRWSFWRGPTRIGAHLIQRHVGSACLGLFGVNWVRRERNEQEG